MERKPALREPFAKSDVKPKRRFDKPFTASELSEIVGKHAKQPPQEPAVAALTPKPNQYANDHKIDAQIPDAKPQRHKKTALGGAIQREAVCLPRTRVRFVGFRVRPLDPDNFAGSVKDCLDGLRHSGLIQGDEPWRIILETEQEKVATFAEERTEITITIP